MQLKCSEKSWRDFADGLSQLGRAEGSVVFLSQAFRLINRFIAVDHCAVFKISLDKTTGAKHLCSFGNLNDDVADLLASRYVKTGYLEDPMIQTAIPRADKVRHIPRAQYNERYRGQFFEKADLIDKVTSLHAKNHALFAINFYRVRRNGQFSNSELKDLERLGPIISQYVLRHVCAASIASGDDSEPPDAIEACFGRAVYGDKYCALIALGSNEATVNTKALVRKVDALLNDNTHIFTQLSQRERQVCRFMLLGFEEKDIAQKLKVAHSTVITYRQRLYAKLNLTSKEELFQLALISTV